MHNSIYNSCKQYYYLSNQFYKKISENAKQLLLLVNFYRSFWIVSFILAVLAAVYYISDLYDKWNDSPIIMSLSPSPTALTSIPFPAITICNMNNAKRSMATTILTE